MKGKTLGQHLVKVVKKALKSKTRGKLVRPKIDVAAVRKELGMTQKEFAMRYHLKLETLRNWEQERRMPDTTTLAYLTCIAKRPKEILKILNQN